MTHWNGFLEWVCHLIMSIRMPDVAGPFLPSPNRWICVALPGTRSLWASTQARCLPWFHTKSWRDKFFETSWVQMLEFNAYLFIFISKIAKTMKKGRITVLRPSVVRDHTQPAEKLTISLAHSSEYCWLFPSRGRFSLSTSSKIPDSVADWWKSAVVPAHPHLDVLKKTENGFTGCPNLEKYFHTHLLFSYLVTGKSLFCCCCFFVCWLNNWIKSLKREWTKTLTFLDDRQNGHFVQI